MLNKDGESATAKVAGNRQFMKRDSIVQFLNLDPMRHGTVTVERPNKKVVEEPPKSSPSFFSRCTQSLQRKPHCT